MPLRYMVLAFDADAPTPKLQLRNGQQPLLVVRELMTEAEFTGMNPLAVHREMERVMDNELAMADGS